MKTIDFNEIATGLLLPEGPIFLSDGSILVVEVLRGCLTRIDPGGKVEVLTDTGGGPNGAAIGPDGACYICNNGGTDWVEHDGYRLPRAEAPANAKPGFIQRVDLDSGEVRVLYTTTNDGRYLCSPNDLVFDAQGGFWFTDHGKVYDRSRDRGSVYYAQTDGSSLVEVITPLDSPNGIGISPDGNLLYVAETYTGHIWSFEIESPGVIRQPQRSALAWAGTIVGRTRAARFPDSLAIDAQGNICVATGGVGGISVFSPDGIIIDELELLDPLTTNICFGGSDMQTAYITLGLTGRLVAFKWGCRGLKLNFNR